jgi:hypothetical protein
LSPIFRWYWSARLKLTTASFGLPVVPMRSSGGTITPTPAPKPMMK